MTNHNTTQTHYPQHHNYQVQTVNHPLSLVLRNFRNLALVNIANSRPKHIQSPIYHVVTQQSQSDDTEEHNNADTAPTAPQIPTLPQNHPLSLVPRNFRNLQSQIIQILDQMQHSPTKHIMTKHSQNDNTYEQIIEQPHTTTFQSQNNHFFSPR